LPCTPRNACELARASAAGIAQNKQPSRISTAMCVLTPTSHHPHTRPRPHPLCRDPVIGWPAPLRKRLRVEHAVYTVNCCPQRCFDLPGQPDAWFRGQGRWGPVPRPCTRPTLPAVSYAPPAVRFRRMSAFAVPPELCRVLASAGRNDSKHGRRRVTRGQACARARGDWLRKGFWHVPRRCPRNTFRSTAPCCLRQRRAVSDYPKVVPGNKEHVSRVFRHQERAPWSAARRVVGETVVVKEEVVEEEEEKRRYQVV